MDKSQFQLFSLFIVSDNKTTISNYNRKQTAILMYQERIKGTEKASPIHTLFHR